jgi:hypothetical protein
MSIARISSLWPRTEILQENLTNLQVYKALYIFSHSVRYQVPLNVQHLPEALELPAGASDRRVEVIKVSVTQFSTSVGAHAD